MRCLLGFVAIATAAIAARFVEGDSSSPEPGTTKSISARIDGMEAQLERIELSLSELRGPDPS